jgi:hypothetical protein
MAYIQSRLEHAGGTKGLFTRDACSIIHYYSRGVPRLINTLCDFSLVYAFAEDRQRVNAKLVIDVIRDKQQGGIFPMRTEEDAEASKIRQHLSKKKIHIGPKAL